MSSAPAEPVAAEPPAEPLARSAVRWLGWAAWLTLFLAVLLPWGCLVYAAGAVYQITGVAWRAGRREHAPPGGE